MTPREEALDLALSGLVAKLDAIEGDPGYASVFALAKLHGAEYHGPTWEREIEAARAVLLHAAGPEEKPSQRCARCGHSQDEHYSGTGCQRRFCGCGTFAPEEKLGLDPSDRKIAALTGQAFVQSHASGPALPPRRIGGGR